MVMTTWSSSSPNCRRRWQHGGAPRSTRCLRATTRPMAGREGVGTWERARAPPRLFGILRTIMLRIGHNTDI
jgi:hypothetical protein